MTPGPEAEGGEWRRTWDDIPYTGSANGVRIDPPDGDGVRIDPPDGDGVRIDPPDGDGWRLLQTIHIPPAPEPKRRARRRGRALLGSMVHVWWRPVAGPPFGI